MVAVIEKNLTAIKDICIRFRVQKMFVFGSAARGVDFTSKSDIDLLYKPDPEIATMHLDEQPDFFEMLFSFENLFGRKVDLINLTKVENPYFIQSVNQNKVKIYEA